MIAFLVAVTLIGPYGVTAEKSCEAEPSAAIVAAAPFLTLSVGDLRGLFQTMEGIRPTPAQRLRDQADEMEAKDAAFKVLLDIAQCAMWKAGSDKIRVQEGDGDVSVDIGSEQGGNRKVCINNDGVLVPGECPPARPR